LSNQVLSLLLKDLGVNDCFGNKKVDPRHVCFHAKQT